MVEVQIPKKGISGVFNFDQSCREASRELPDDVDLLRVLEHDESNAIYQLEHSNEELLKALQDEEDADFRMAVEENLGILQRKKERLAIIAAKIRLLVAAAGGSFGLPCLSQTPPTGSTHLYRPEELPDGMFL